MEEDVDNKKFDSTKSNVTLTLKLARNLDSMVGKSLGLASNEFYT